MLPTLLIGDHILVSKLGYGFDIPGLNAKILDFRPPRRMDVVVFRNTHKLPGVANQPEHFIKRIVGLPGETVQVKDFEVSVNGQRLVEYDHIITSKNPVMMELHRGNFGPVSLGADEYYVLGDNRINSKDSRFFGPIHERDLEGRAFMTYWSWKSAKTLDVRWDRVGRKIR